jgi:hypothetical protein
VGNKKKLYRFGLGLFTTGSLLCAISPSSPRCSRPSNAVGRWFFLINVRNLRLPKSTQHFHTAAFDTFTACVIAMVANTDERSAAE